MSNLHRELFATAVPSLEVTLANAQAVLDSIKENPAGDEVKPVLDAFAIRLNRAMEGNSELSVEEQLKLVKTGIRNVLVFRKQLDASLCKSLDELAFAVKQHLEALKANRSFERDQKQGTKRKAKEMSFSTFEKTYSTSANIVDGTVRLSKTDGSEFTLSREDIGSSVDRLVVSGDIKCNEPLKFECILKSGGKIECSTTSVVHNFQKGERGLTLDLDYGRIVIEFPRKVS